MFLMVIFLFTFLSQIDSACLPDFEAIPGESKCLFSSYGEHSGRPKAACSYKGTIPAKIENAFENSFVFSKLTDPDFSENIAYIGVEKQNGVWVYSDGSALTYTNWANGEPNSFEECAIMDRLSGKWKAENCGGAYPFFCTHGEINSSCPDDWVSSEQTGFCYYLHNFTVPNCPNWDLYHVTKAEENCQSMNSHLVSIHSDQENYFVLQLANTYTIFIDFGNCCNIAGAWIGYYGNQTIGSGNWTDGSRVDWVESESITWPKDYNWGVISDDSCFAHNWNLYYPPNLDKAARHICKMSPPMKN